MDGCAGVRAHETGFDSQVSVEAVPCGAGECCSLGVITQHPYTHFKPFIHAAWSCCCCRDPGPVLWNLGLAVVPGSWRTVCCRRSLPCWGVPLFWCGHPSPIDTFQTIPDGNLLLVSVDLCTGTHLKYFTDCLPEMPNCLSRLLLRCPPTLGSKTLWEWCSSTPRHLPTCSPMKVCC